MQLIRDDFHASIRTEIEVALGLYFVLNVGRVQYAQIANSYPNSRAFVGSGNPISNPRTIAFAPTHSFVSNTLAAQPNLVFEGFHASIVQHWFDFLLKVYTFCAGEAISGVRHRNIPDIDIAYNFERAPGVSLETSLVIACREAFDFKQADEKLRVVRTALGVDLQGVQSEVRVIKENIIIRNMIQHNKGIIRDEDLRRLGANSISCDEGNAVIQKVAGDRVQRTAYDLEACVTAMMTVSSVLVP